MSIRISDSNNFMTGRKWLYRLQKLLSEMPVTMEISIGTSTILALPAGWWEEHVSWSDLDLVTDGGTISDASVHSIGIDRSRIHVVGEEI